MSRARRNALSFLCAVAAFGSMVVEAAEIERNDVYVRPGSHYHTFRIPSLVVTASGILLAFCEGRTTSGSDSGDIDLLVRRSRDGGRTFDAEQIVWNDGANTCGNPCALLDRDTGVVWLLMTHNLGSDNESAITKRTGKGTRTVWITQSADEGVTWSAPKEITTTVKQPEWTWYATGPGAGMQMRDGRFVIPCDHRENDRDFSHVIVSDDHGATWKLGGRVGPGCNECEAVELPDGKLLLNMRNYNPQRSHRAISLSRDRGVTWSAPRPDLALVEPTCQASIRRITWGEAGKKSGIVFSNPASQGARENLTVRLSEDECATWAHSKVLHAGPSAYSSLAMLPDQTIVCLFENGAQNPYEKITLARFTRDWLTKP